MTCTRPLTHPSYRAFTLAEAVVSTAIIGMIAAGLGGALVVVAKAAPENNTKLASRAKLNTGLDQLLGELKYLTSVRTEGANSFEFTVADRDGNGVDEIIRYDWAGAGSSIMRSYNNGAPVELIPQVQSFSLSSQKNKTTVTQSTTGSASSGEVLLSTFTNWPLGVPSQLQLAITSTTWVGSYCKVDNVTLPSNVSRLDITKLKVKLKKASTPTGTVVTAGIYTPAVSGGPNPGTLQVGSTSSVALSTMTTSFAWIEFPLTGVTFSRPITEFNFIVKGSGTTAATAMYYQYALAPANGPVFLTTANSGSTWTPTASTQQQYDIPYEVWGTYSWPTNSTTSVDTYRLKSIALIVEHGTPSTRIETSVRTLNEPVVTGP